ncbi:glutathione S-transferase family protein [Hyphomonas sp.]|uniref:glutathione S-transferase family protein n=1 Tax=Hyphomonas sp. TaxID=87 RepID=UPI001BCCD1BB|nr:glutathione S-transferase family protein [Hyphomonas sp.]
MKLYHSPMAPNPDRVVYFLRAKGKLDAVDLQEVSIMQQDHKKPEYRDVSPFSQVPALVLDDGTKLTESRAICTYFEGIFPEPNLMGADPREKALIEMWDRRIELMFFIQFAGWFRNSHPMMAPLEVPQSAEAAAKSEKAARKMAERLNEHLASNEFVAADRFSIADITLFITCGFCRVMKWAPHKEHAHLGRWYDAMAQRGFAG